MLGDDIPVNENFNTFGMNKAKPQNRQNYQQEDNSHFQQQIYDSSGMNPQYQQEMQYQQFNNNHQYQQQNYYVQRQSGTTQYFQVPPDSQLNSSSNGQFQDNYNSQYDDEYEYESYEGDYEDDGYIQDPPRRDSNEKHQQQYYVENNNYEMNGQSLPPVPPLPEYIQNQNRLIDEPHSSPFMPPQTSLPELPSTYSPTDNKQEIVTGMEKDQRFQEQSKDIKNDAALESLKQSNHEHWKEVKQIYSMEIEEYKELEKHYVQRENPQNNNNQSKMVYNEEPADDESSYGSDAINDIISDLNSFNPADTINNPICYIQGPNNKNIKNPKNNSQSPMHGPESPMHGPESPIRGPESPMRRPESPMRGPESPMRRPESPMRGPESPMRRPQSPMRGPESPKRRPQSPRNHSQSPMVYAQSPLHRSQSPMDSYSNNQDNFNDADGYKQINNSMNIQSPIAQRPNQINQKSPLVNHQSPLNQQLPENQKSYTDEQYPTEMDVNQLESAQGDTVQMIMNQQTPNNIEINNQQQIRIPNKMEYQQESILEQQIQEQSNDDKDEVPNIDQNIQAQNQTMTSDDKIQQNINEKENYEEDSYDLNDFIDNTSQENEKNIDISPSSDDEKKNEKYEFEDFHEHLEKSLRLDKEFNENYKNKHVSLSLSLPSEQVDPFDNDDTADIGYNNLSSHINSANDNYLSPVQSNNITSSAQNSDTILSNQENVKLISPLQDNDDGVISSIYESDNAFNNTKQTNQQIDQLMILGEKQQQVADNESLNNNNHPFYPDVVEESIIAGQDNDDAYENNSISSEANHFADLIDEVMTSGNKDITFDDQFPITDESCEQDSESVQEEDVIDITGLVSQIPQTDTEDQSDSEDQLQEQPVDPEDQLQEQPIDSEDQLKEQPIEPEDQLQEQPIEPEDQLQEQLINSEEQPLGPENELQKETVQIELKEQQSKQDYLYNIFPGLKENENEANSSQMATTEKQFIDKEVGSALVSPVGCISESDQKLLNEKLQEVEAERNQFIAGNERLKKMQAETEQLRLKFESDKAAFERYVTEEKQKIEEMKEEELRRIKREQLLSEKQKREEELLPSVQDKQEIKALKEEIEKLKEEEKEKESKYKLTVDRLRKQIDDLTKKNNELHEEIKVLEKERAMNMKINKENERRGHSSPSNERVRSMFPGDRGIRPVGSKERIKSMHPGQIPKSERVKSMHPGMEMEGRDRERDRERVKSMHPGMEMEGRDRERDRERVKSMHPGMEMEGRDRERDRERVKSMHPGMEMEGRDRERDRERVKSMHPGGPNGPMKGELRDRERVKSMHPGGPGLHKIGSKDRMMEGRERVRSVYQGGMKPTRENSTGELNSDNKSPMKGNKPELSIDQKNNNNLAVSSPNGVPGKSPISKTALGNRVTLLDVSSVPKRKSSVIPPLNHQLMRQTMSPGGVSPISGPNTPNSPSNVNGNPGQNYLTVGTNNNDKHNIAPPHTPTTPTISNYENKKMGGPQKPVKNGSIDSIGGVQVRHVNNTNVNPNTSPILKNGSNVVPKNTNITNDSSINPNSSVNNKNIAKNDSVETNSTINVNSQNIINGPNKNANSNENLSPVSVNSIESPLASPINVNNNVPKSRKIPVGIPQNIPPNVNIFTAMERALDLPPPIDEIKIDEGKFKRIYPNGTTLISFKNGTIKEINAEGTSIIRFPNGDIKQVLSNKEVVYFYHETKAIQTTHTNGIEVFEFPNGQIETKYPDSSIEIIFPDKTIRRIFPDGQEENVYANGIKMRTTQDGKKMVDYPDGSKEIYTESYRKLIKTDGTIRIIYADGRRETQFPNGHVVVKDAKGNIIGESAKPN
ncbi:hypothetical protein BCR36DRAFT_339697 [Piromyces finnis]|uniref:Centromere protein J C-terminal domain-containing protein n=1 Tax=Piromyces finnis TaxID=1754191 RepID=A0A1Y1UVQ3_9FUNG|nr:hypothetical protein BCR36DRAFT_339697 [Piromyces finnis]|eukprot:ORX41315.1 hypothetical protein BCR36DRAFT_339697 [Piromyces finnis]